MKVKDLMLDRFSQLPASLSPSDALGKMLSDSLGVVVDASGNPLALVTVADLLRAEQSQIANLEAPEADFPPTIVVGSGIEMTELAKSNLLRLSSLGANGAIVLGGPTSIIGILSFDSIILRAFAADRTTLSKAATALPGDPTTPQGILKCKGCSYLNKIDFIDYNNLPFCENPAPPKHTLKV